MRQLITRIDDDLHARLKRRAAAEGRSLNSLVEEALEATVAAGRPGRDVRRDVQMRIERLGLRVVTPAPKGRIPSHQAAAASLRGTGAAVLDALLDERRSR